LETVCHDYAPKGVEFFYVYKALAHPETNGYVTPFTLAERLMQVKEAERRLGSKFTWLCDTMSNDLKHALGNAPNSEFVVDPEGKIVVRRLWSDPDQLRKDLASLVGAVDPPTPVSALHLNIVPPPKVAARGVVPRLKVPGPTKPLIIHPRESKTPYYAKLRAEVDEGYLKTGKGKLYIGFHMDPIYRVHWNNLAAPVHFELTPPRGVAITPTSGDGPKVKEPADIDPREFLLDIEGKEATQPIQLTVRYFACNDDEGWCRPVTQTYTIDLAVDPDGGWASARHRRPPSKGNRSGARGARPGRPGVRPPGGRGPAQLMARIRANDKNHDGKITRDEASPMLKRFFDRIDADRNGAITREEVREFIKNRGPSDSTPRP